MHALLFNSISNNVDEMHECVHGAVVRFNGKVGQLRQ
jgi:hypothetical protein